MCGGRVHGSGKPTLGVRVPRGHFQPPGREALLQVLGPAGVTAGPRITGELTGGWHCQCGCVLTKCCLWKQVAGWMWPVGYSLLTPAYEQSCRKSIKINFEKNVGACVMNL